MCGADSVAAHVLEQFELMTECRPVDGGAERPEIVVIAHTLEFTQLAVEIEPMFGNHLYRAYAESCIVTVEFCAVCIKDTCHGMVERRTLRRPQLRLRNFEVLQNRLARYYGDIAAPCCHCPVFRIDYVGNECEIAAVGIGNFCFKAHGRECLADMRGGEVGAPYRNMNRIGLYKVYVAVKAGAGIPTRR